MKDKTETETVAKQIKKTAKKFIEKKESEEEVNPAKFKLRKGEFIGLQPGTNLYKAKIGYMYCGLFRTKKLAQDAIVDNREL